MVVLRPKGKAPPVEVCRDQLPVRGFNIYNCNDYMLGEGGGVWMVRRGRVVRAMVLCVQATASSHLCVVIVTLCSFRLW